MSNSLEPLDATDSATTIVRMRKTTLANRYGMSDNKRNSEAVWKTMEELAQKIDALSTHDGVQK
jgi:hypothetical protein